MKTIYVLRHAKAVNGTPDMQDFDRPLTPLGQQNAADLGTRLSTDQTAIEQVLCSTAARARETWEALRQSWNAPTPTKFLDKLYLASAGDILHEIQQIDNAKTNALIIGHNPGLHHFCLTVASSGNEAAMHDLEMQFPTCSFVAIDAPVNRWSEVEPNTAQVRYFWHDHATADRIE